MKSKSVASILRHVASKIPSVNADPSAIAEAPVDSPEKETVKRSRRASKANAHEEAVPEADATQGAGGSNEEERLEMLYDTIGWPLGKTYGHPYDAFKLALTCVILHFSEKDFSLKGFV